MRGPTAVTLVLAFGTLVSHGFGLALVPAMLPYIAAEMGSGYGPLGAVVAAGLVLYSVGALSAGRLIDRLPGVGLLIGTYAGGAGGLALAAVATTPRSLALATAVLGFVAPVSWATSLHVAGAAVPLRLRSAVMAAAGSGAALGVLINGVLVQTSSTIHSWRVSFVVAAAIAVIPIAGGLATLPKTPAPARPARTATPRPSMRRASASPAGRVVVLSSLAAGLGGFPFNAFLTATATDEMRLGAATAASLWWVIGILGVVAGPVMGRYGDRRSPVLALVAGWAAYGAGLVVLSASWGRVGLVVAVAGYAVMNYPIWGLVGAIADAHLAREAGVRMVALGLVGASLGGALGNLASGAWIDATASFRGPVAAMAAVAVVMAWWLLRVERRGGVAAIPPGGEPTGRAQPA